MPGVRAVWTGADVASAQPVPVWGIGEQMALTPQPPLARDKATCAGYPVAAVAAESRYLARDAADLVEVEYEPLPAVTTVEQALAPDAPLLYPELGSNEAFHYTKEAGDVDGAFARADRTVFIRIQHSRVAQIPMEPRAILASYDREADLLTVWRGTQSPHVTKNALSIALGRPDEGIRVIAPDGGGAFGSKGPVYPEEVAVVMLAMALGVPVRWISTRMEDLQLNMQGRDHWDEVEAAFTHDGVITALKTRSPTNFGCIAMMTTAMPPIRIPTYATGAYRIPAIRSEMIAAYTTTAPTGPYRGAGRPEAAYIAERVVHEVARALDLDPVEVRRKNFLQPADFPYTTPNGAFYDSGDYERAMDRALELLDYAAERRRQREARARGALVGIGTASTVEVSSTAWESGAIEVQPDGTIVARTGSSPHGQGHETSFAQVVADYLQVPFESIRLIHGDTATTPYGLGTGGSRSMSLGGSALAQASEEIKKKALQVAAAMLEVSVDDLVYERGSVQVAGAPERRLTLVEIARAAESGVGLPPGERGLTYDGRFNPGKDSVPFGTALAVVKVDPETGKVDLQRLVVVDDCGTIVNPLLVEG
jgi:carbon-monoxide dehydrogenase large subunit